MEDMENNGGRVMMLLRSKTVERGGFASVSGSPLVGNSDVDGNLWTRTVKPRELLLFNSPGAGVKAVLVGQNATTPILKTIQARLTAAGAATAIHTVQLLAKNTLAVSTVIWQTTISAAANQTADISLQDLNIDIAATLTALGGGTLTGVGGFTLQFLAAPALGEFQNVSMSSYDAG